MLLRTENASLVSCRVESRGWTRVRQNITLETIPLRMDSVLDWCKLCPNAFWHVTNLRMCKISVMALMAGRTLVLAFSEATIQVGHYHDFLRLIP